MEGGNSSTAARSQRFLHAGRSVRVEHNRVQMGACGGQPAFVQRERPRAIGTILPAAKDCTAAWWCWRGSSWWKTRYRPQASQATAKEAKAEEGGRGFVCGGLGT